MITNTGHTWHEVGQYWTIPRVEALKRSLLGFPSLTAMVGHYLGYKPTEEAPKARETTEEAAARIMKGLGGFF